MSPVQRGQDGVPGGGTSLGRGLEGFMNVGTMHTAGTCLDDWRAGGAGGAGVQRGELQPGLMALNMCMGVCPVLKVVGSHGG